MTVEATIVNNMPTPAPMVIVDLPIPGGFRLEADELEQLQRSGQIAKCEVTARQAIVYLRELLPGAELVLRYRLTATMPVKVTVPPGTVYEYHDPQKRDQTTSLQLQVDERQGGGS